MKERYTNKRQIILNFFSMKFCVDLEKHIVRNILYLNYELHGKKSGYIEVGLLVLFLWICQNPTSV